MTDNILYQECHRRYEYRDGYLYNRITTNYNSKAGALAGGVNSLGYRVVEIDNKKYVAHRLIFLMRYGYLPHEVDHINNNKLDNRISNLRGATHRQNKQNVLLQSNNTSGVKGVSWKKQDGKWRARCTVDGRERSLGLFSNIKDAEAAVRKFREKHHGEFANHG